MARRGRAGWGLLAPLVLVVACGTPYGIYHSVRPGQTFYRICRTYGADPAAVARLNRISDPTRLQVGQRLFIPGAVRPLEVEPPATRFPPPAGGPRRVSAPPPNAEPPPGDDAPGESLLWPLRGILESPFGRRNGREHSGVDLAAPPGTPIRAAADGRVIYSDSRIRGYGNMVILRHAGDLATVYAHNQANLVREGEFVRRGQVIARVGETGRATGPHLHFEVRRANVPQDPARYLP